MRRAIAHAINRQLLVDALLGGYGRPVTILLTPANFGYIEGMKGYPFDPTRARQLLKEAGAEGAEISFYTSPAYDQRLVQAIQQMLQEVGLKVAISQTDQPTFLQAPPGKARGGRQHLARAMVVRLPGRGRRDLPPVPQPEPLGEVREPRLRRRGHAGPGRR